MAVFTGSGSAASPSITFSADTNTGIFSPGADQVAISTNGTNRLHITSAGLVGIGTTSPGVSLEVAGPTGDNIISTFRSGDATAANNAGGGFRSISSATAASRLAQVWLDADGANLSGGDYFFIQKNGNSGTVDFNQFSNAAMTFKTNDIERARIDSSGRLLVGTSTQVGNVNGGILQLGSGITFPATQVAATDANTLDDYEEGTWTASVTGGTFTNLSTGSYTKIGRQVFAYFQPATTAISGNLSIAGLPFTAATRSPLVVATAPPFGITYLPLFVDGSDIYVNVTGTYSGGSVTSYFACVYEV